MVISNNIGPVLVGTNTEIPSVPATSLSYLAPGTLIPPGTLPPALTTEAVRRFATRANPKSRLIYDTKWVTIAGQETTGVKLPEGLTPPVEHYLDGGPYTNLTLRLFAPAIHNAQLDVETSSAPDSVPWDNITTDSSSVKRVVALSSEGGDFVFARYIRWAVHGQTENWWVCFRLQITA